MADPLSTYDQIFEDAGKAWNVDPLLLKSIAKQESGGKANAVSKSKAQGLMQIIPSTQKYLGVTDPFDPVQSIFAGAKYLSEGLDKEGNPEGALLYYHGGPGWRENYGKESAAYVPAVTSHYKMLSARAQQAAQPTSSAPLPPSQPANLPASPGYGPLTPVPGAPTVMSVPPMPAVNGLKPNG